MYTTTSGVPRDTGDHADEIYILFRFGYFGRVLRLLKKKKKLFFVILFERLCSIRIIYILIDDPLDMIW